MADKNDLDVVSQWLVIDFIRASDEVERNAIYESTMSGYGDDERLAVTQMVVSMLCDIFDGMSESNPGLGRQIDASLTRVATNLPPRP